MNLASAPMQPLETVDRRVLGAIRFVDALSGLPVNGFMRLEARSATVIRPSGTTPVPLGPDGVRFVRNRTGRFVIERAPLFEDYTNEFLSPTVPPSLENGILRLRLALVTAAPGYLAQEFDFDLPRSLSADAATALHGTDDVTGLTLSDAPFAVPVVNGQFSVSGQAVTVSTGDTLGQIFAAINTATSDAATARYDAAADQIVLTSTSPLVLGAPADTSNFLVAARLSTNGRKVVRSQDRIAASVFVPLDVPLFRSPSARSENSWIIVRARVVKTGTGEPLPGVLVRVFRSPRAPTDAPIGFGLSDWRVPTTGESFIAVAGIPRFWPGSGSSVVETEQPIAFEAVRDPSFTGAPDQLPCVTSLLSGSKSGLILAPDLSPPVPAPAPVRNVSACREYAVTLTMP